MTAKSGDPIPFARAKPIKGGRINSKSHAAGHPCQGHRKVEAPAGRTIAEMRESTASACAERPSPEWHTVTSRAGSTGPPGAILANRPDRAKYPAKSRGRGSASGPEVASSADTCAGVDHGRLDDHVGGSKRVAPPRGPPRTTRRRAWGRAAGSAAFPYGDPRAVGRGERAPAAGAPPRRIPRPLRARPTQKSGLRDGRCCRNRCWCNGLRERALAGQARGQGARAGADVPGAEASSAAAGVLGAQMESHDDGPVARLCLASRALYAHLAADLQERTGIDVGYRPCGIAHRELELRRHQ